MRNRFTAFALAIAATSVAVDVGVAAKAKSSSTEVRVAGKVAYHLPAGARMVGDPVPSPKGDATAFVEQREGALSLVVLIKDAQPARWGLPPEAVAYRVFWAAPQRVILGPSELEPKLTISWHVSYE